MTKNFFEKRGIDLPKLYEQENESNPIAHAHFTKESIDGRVWDWFVCEGRREENGDWLLFGLVNGEDKELGYFTLMQIASVGAGFDEDFKPVGIYDIYEDFDLRR